MFSAPDPRCPNCGGRIDTKPFSVSALFGTMVVTDIATYALAGLFALAGLMWGPAYLIALVIVVVALVRSSAKRALYVCTRCDREFTHGQLYAVKKG